MMISVMVSCSHKNSEETDTTVTTSGEQSDILISDKIKGVRFNGEEIKIWQITKTSNPAKYFTT